MATSHRRPEIRFSDAPWGVCRWCGEEILVESGDKQGNVNRRRRWHQPCVDLYNASDPQEARRRIRKRDRGRCAACGIDTNKVRRELRKIGRGRHRAMRERGYKPRKSFWELDHIVPLIDGGSHADENLQSLCTPCHTAKTADEARARAARRSAAAESDQVVSPAARNKATSDVKRNLTDEATRKTKRAKMKATKAKTELSFDELMKAAEAVNAKAARALSEFASR
jgi:5-methylcytosine-specific restriction endonuclease McrA